MERQAATRKGHHEREAVAGRPVLAARGVGVAKIVEEAKAMLADGGVAEASLDHDLDKTREPTSGLEPLTCSLRVIKRVLQGLARVCESPLSKPISFLCLALCCTALRSRWCQSGVNITLCPPLTKGSLVRRFYDLLRKALKSPSATPAAAARLTVGCISSQL
jgi:hypothetical protein